MQQVTALTGIEAGLQFRASTVTATQIAAFNLDDIVALMRKHAPDVWTLLDGLLAADPRADERRLAGGKASAKRARERRRGPKASVDLDGDEIMRVEAEREENAASEDEYWREPQEIPEELSSKELAEERQ